MAYSNTRTRHDRAMRWLCNSILHYLILLFLLVFVLYVYKLMEKGSGVPVKDFCAREEHMSVTLDDRYRQGITVPSVLSNDVINRVKKFVVFVGYPRSGHSILGSLLDSHPNMVVSDEYFLFRKYLIHPEKHRNRDFLFNAIYKNSVCSYYFGQRTLEAVSKGYTLHVDDSWQGRYNGSIVVMGDKSGGMTTQLYELFPEDLVEMYETLKLTVKVPVYTIHAIRNPYDNIATMVLNERGLNVNKLQIDPRQPYKNERLLDQKIADYLLLVQAASELLDKVSKTNLIEVHNMDLTSEPRQTFRRICEALQVSCTEHFLEGVAGKVFHEPARSRYLIAWTPEQIRHVERVIVGRYDFLRRYSFDQ